MAKADSSEIAILPMVMTSAVTRLTHIMRATGAFEPGAAGAAEQGGLVVVDQSGCRAGAASAPAAISCARVGRGDEGQVEREGDDQDAEDHHHVRRGCQVARSTMSVPARPPEGH